MLEFNNSRVHCLKELKGAQEVIVDSDGKVWTYGYRGYSKFQSIRYIDNPIVDARFSLLCSRNLVEAKNDFLYGLKGINLLLYRQSLKSCEPQYLLKNLRETTGYPYNPSSITGRHLVLFKMRGCK